jgi:phage shock protein PspC (stress-responsive transcriptional regulator)
MNTETIDTGTINTDTISPDTGATNPGSTTATEPGRDTRFMPQRPLLRRSYADRMLGGVAGGLARYFGVDPTLVRVAFVIATLVGGAGVPLYLAGLLLIPDEGSNQSLAGSFIESLQSRPR